MEINKPRFYSDVTDKMPVEYYDYRRYEIPYADPENYEIVEQLAETKFAILFMGVNAVNRNKVAIKLLKPGPRSKVQREVKILRTLRGHANIIGLQDVLFDAGSGLSSLAFDFVSNEGLLGLTLTDFDVRLYMHGLVSALHCCHSRGIMHRGVQPDNVLVDPLRKALRLVGFGSAEYYHQGNRYSTEVGERLYRPPELLLGNEHYDYNADVWQAGAIFASLLFRRRHLFLAAQPLHAIAAVLGTQGLHLYVRKYGLKLPRQHASLPERLPPTPWKRFVTKDNQHLVSDEGLDLLSRMLVYDHVARINAK